MQYIVLDLEWNQPPIGGKAVHVPFPLVGEVIEFGAVKLDENFFPCEDYRAFVRPHFYRRIHPYVKKITGIKESTVKDEPAFPEAVKLFFDFCGSDCTLITWGPDDLPMLCDNMLAHGLDTSIIPPAINLQHIFNMQKTEGNVQWSLAAACELLGIERQLPDHDAYADAYHTGLICSKLDMKAGIENYPADLKPQRHYEHTVKRKKAALYPEHVLELGLGLYSSRREGMQDMDVVSPPCPKCGEGMTAEEYISQTKDKKISRCACPMHGEYMAKIFFHRKDEGYDTMLRVYPMTDNLKKIMDKATTRRKAQLVSK